MEYKTEGISWEDIGISNDFLFGKIIDVKTELYNIYMPI